MLLRFRALVESGAIGEADRHLEAAERLTEELGQPTLRWLVGLTRTARTILAGNLEEGERRAQAGFVLAQASGQPDAARFLAAHLFLVRFDQGRLGEVEDRMMEFVPPFERDGVVPGILMFRAWLALLLCELDRPDEAIEHYEVLAIANFTGVRQNTSWMITLLPCAAVCAYLGDQARARVLFDLLMSYAGQIGYTGAGAVGTVAHYLALLATTSGDFDEAERRFADAASTHEQIGAPHWLARTQLEWARTLLLRGRPGDTERAQELLGQALAIARQRGLGNIERRAVQLLT